MSNNIIKPKNKYHLVFSIFLLFSFLSLASAQILVFYDNMTDFPFGWTTGGTSGPWTASTNRSKTTPTSAKCTPNATYSNNQNNWMQHNIDLTGYVYASVSFQIWQNTLANDFIYLEYYSGSTWTTHWSRAGNYGGFSQIVLVNIPSTATALRFRFASDTSGTAEGVYIDDVYLWGYRYDVGCTQIIAPTGTIDSGRTVTPKAVVQNFGDFISTFPVRMKIGSLYNSAVQVVNLAPGATTTVSFPDFTPLERNIQMVRCSTEHPNDIFRANDQILDTIIVKVIDVGTEEIISPFGIIDSGQTVTPRAVVRNYGTHTETFNAYFKIGSFYTSNRTITLNSGAAETTSFDQWNVLQRGVQNTSCSTALITDSVINNNRQTSTVDVRVRDVGVYQIYVPANYIDSSATRTPLARIQNYGTHIVNLNAFFRITGPGVNWSSTLPVANLNPGELRLITFSSWTVGPRGSYVSRCSTGLVGDQVLTNDTKDTTFNVRVRDVGVTNITSPPATVDSNTTVPVSATVQNFGTEIENFTVIFRIGSYYTSNRSVNLNPSSSTVVNFDNWLVNAPRGSYTPRCSSALSVDANPTNNLRTSITTVNVHDVGVTLIVSPATQVDSTTVNPVVARITNYGTYSESFSALFRIGSFYVSTRSLNLTAGSFSDVAFDSWSVTRPRGSYTAKCSTNCNTDLNSLNNILTRTTTVMVHDVGVVSINSPPAQVDTNSTVTVSATINNSGTYTESFNVIFKIGTFYSSVVPVNLNPSATQNVTFNNWLVAQPRGTYPLQCSTQVANDVVPNNNRRTGSVIINVHDAMVLNFSGLPTSVDSGNPTPIAAVVGNLGTTAETFDVNCRIGSVYNCTKTINLNPGISTTVPFDTWLPLVRNSHTIKCSTRLNTDLVHNNDYQQDNIFVNVRDIGALQIIAPLDTVALAESIVPIARFKNLGNLTATVPLFFQISFGPVVLYSNQIDVLLDPGVDTMIQFNTWLPESMGSHIAQIRCSLVNDLNPANDLMVDTLTVLTDMVWQQKSDLPLGPGKRVKKGGALVYAPPSAIYAFKGSNTNQFFRYNIATDTWTQVCTIPYSPLAKKRVKSGSALCYGNEYIYALKGSNTTEFWRYHITTDSWQEMKPVPLGPKQRKVKTGSGLVFQASNGNHYIYCLKGSSTMEFYTYWVEMDSWLTLSPVPLDSSGKLMKAGSCIVGNGANLIYALKGKVNEFYAYDILTDSWNRKPMMPIAGIGGTRKKAKDGASLAYDGMNLIYAFKGNSTQEFWAYDMNAETWLSKEPVPLGTSYRRIKAGGALCYANSVQRAFGFKGGNTNEFWMYIPLPTAISASKNPISGAMSTDANSLLDQFSLKIAPSPITRNATVKYQLPGNKNIVLKLYDACGSLKHISYLPQAAGTITINSEGLSVGVYVLRLQGNKNTLAKKIVISR